MHALLPTGPRGIDTCARIGIASVMERIMHVIIYAYTHTCMINGPCIACSNIDISRFNCDGPDLQVVAGWLPEQLEQSCRCHSSTRPAGLMVLGYDVFR